MKCSSQPDSKQRKEKFRNLLQFRAQFEKIDHTLIDTRLLDILTVTSPLGRSAEGEIFLCPFHVYQPDSDCLICAIPSRCKPLLRVLWETSEGRQAILDYHTGEHHQRRCQHEICTIHCISCVLSVHYSKNDQQITFDIESQIQPVPCLTHDSFDCENMVCKLILYRTMEALAYSHQNIKPGVKLQMLGTLAGVIQKTEEMKDLSIVLERDYSSVDRVKIKHNHRTQPVTTAKKSMNNSNAEVTLNPKKRTTTEKPRKEPQPKPSSNTGGEQRTLPPNSSAEPPAWLQTILATSQQQMRDMMATFDNRLQSEKQRHEEQLKNMHASLETFKQAVTSKDKQIQDLRAQITNQTAQSGPTEQPSTNNRTADLPDGVIGLTPEMVNQVKTTTSPLRNNHHGYKQTTAFENDQEQHLLLVRNVLIPDYCDQPPLIPFDYCLNHLDHMNTIRQWAQEQLKQVPALCSDHTCRPNDEAKIKKAWTEICHIIRNYAQAQMASTRMGEQPTPSPRRTPLSRFGSGITPISNNTIKLFARFPKAFGHQDIIVKPGLKQSLPMLDIGKFNGRDTIALCEAVHEFLNNATDLAESNPALSQQNVVAIILDRISKPHKDLIRREWEKTVSSPTDADLLRQLYALLEKKYCRIFTNQSYLSEIIHNLQIRPVESIESFVARMHPLLRIKYLSYPEDHADELIESECIQKVRQNLPNKLRKTLISITNQPHLDRLTLDEMLQKIAEINDADSIQGYKQRPVNVINFHQDVPEDNIESNEPDATIGPQQHYSGIHFMVTSKLGSFAVDATTSGVKEGCYKCGEKGHLANNKTCKLFKTYFTRKKCPICGTGQHKPDICPNKTKTPAEVQAVQNAKRQSRKDTEQPNSKSTKFGTENARKPKPEENEKPTVYLVNQEGDEPVYSQEELNVYHLTQSVIDDLYKSDLSSDEEETTV